ncbi:hypothetical protein [Blastococcus xanthinilyticus]|uniref:Uncharacterized protein n=1 Tax=Blastococcus xanthinilyticus TaxID=1564164 RepID=A0A5S5CPS6_9ACTN|nr:hypothetical protein [Blastococcus xanthinilyticus]TYP82033.1 hypothetical protein BD833_12017 [Blastococcus xanthinilyticus]
MTAPARGKLVVVRVQVARNCFVATVPMLRAAAELLAENLLGEIAQAGDSPRLVPLDTGDVGPCWLRARSILTVEVIAPDDFLGDFIGRGDPS